MTAADSLDAHPDAARHAVTRNGFLHVFRAGRIEPARARKHGRDPALVKPKGRDYGCSHRDNSLSISRSSCSGAASSTARRGLMTRSQRRSTRAKRSRSISRIRRFARLRFVALPKARGMVKPMRGPWPSSRGTGSAKAANKGPDTFRPCSYTRRKSADFRMRTVFGNEKELRVPDDSLVTDGQLVTAFRAASREHGAAVFSSHAHAKSVSLCPSSIVWLKSSFWHLHSIRASESNRATLSTKFGQIT